jgi:type III pantothenate kinase
MNVNLLAISIGNTRTQFGTFVDGKIIERQILTNDSMSALGVVLDQGYAALRDVENAAVVLASVNPRLTDAIAQAVADKLGTVSQRVERDLPIPIGRQLDRESLVGDDRLLNAAAAYDTLKQACVVVDAGTAITVDFIDGAGTFHGGAIGPGARMMMQSMHRGTSQLPEIEMQRPEEAIGHNTAEAMRSAVFHGLRGMVRELTEKYAEVAGSYPTVIATGGDAEMLFGDYELVERVVPDLTLLGIAVTLQAAQQAAEEDAE